MKPSPYGRLSFLAREHIDRICRSMREKPPDPPGPQLPVKLTAQDVKDAERLLTRTTMKAKHAPTGENADGRTRKADQ